MSAFSSSKHLQSCSFFKFETCIIYIRVYLLAVFWLDSSKAGLYEAANRMKAEQKLWEKMGINVPVTAKED